MVLNPRGYFLYLVQGIWNASAYSVSYCRGLLILSTFHKSTRRSQILVLLIVTRSIFGESCTCEESGWFDVWVCVQYPRVIKPGRCDTVAVSLQSVITPCLVLVGSAFTKMFRALDGASVSLSLYYCHCFCGFFAISPLPLSPFPLYLDANRFLPAFPSNLPLLPFFLFYIKVSQHSQASRNSKLKFSPFKATAGVQVQKN